MLKPLDSTSIIFSISIRPDGATFWRQIEIAAFDIEEVTLAWLALLVAYLAAAVCRIEEKIKTLAQYCRGWWLDAKLTWYAAINNEGAYNGLAWT